MPDHGYALYPQQRSAAVFRIIDLLPKTLVSLAREHVPDLRTDGALQGFLQHRRDMLRDAFADLQGDISDEPIADDDVHGAVENISTFDVARKIHRGDLQTAVSLARQLVAF